MSINRPGIATPRICGTRHDKLLSLKNNRQKRA